MPTLPRDVGIFNITELAMYVPFMGILEAPVGAYRIIVSTWHLDGCRSDRSVLRALSLAASLSVYSWTKKLEGNSFIDYRIAGEAFEICRILPDCISHC